MTTAMGTGSDRERSVREFGAAGDGVANDTAAVRRAASHLAARGGGTLVFPPGRYLTGTVPLCSDLTVELRRGAVVAASPDLRDYIEDTAVNPASGLRHYLFEGRGLRNVALRGDGAIDGNGDAYWEPHPSPAARVMLAKKQRPVLVHLVDCERIAVRDISIVNAPAYTIWLLGCRDAAVSGVTVRNKRNGPNTDVLDIDCCRNVLVSDCNFEAGDDCVALKSDGARLGRRTPCENVVVTDCVLSSLTTGVRIGYEADEPIRDCVFSNLVIHDTRHGLDILSLVPDARYTTIERGTPVENILFSDIVMRNVRRAVHVWAGGGDAGKYDASVRGLSFHNIRARTTGSSFIGSVGGEARVSDVLLRDVVIEQAADEFDGDAAPVEYPVNCWGAGRLPYSLTLRKVDGLFLDTVRIERAPGLPADGGRLTWTGVRNGLRDGGRLPDAGEVK